MEIIEAYPTFCNLRGGGSIPSVQPSKIKYLCKAIHNSFSFCCSHAALRIDVSRFIPFKSPFTERLPLLKLTDSIQNSDIKIIHPFFRNEGGGYSLKTFVRNSRVCLWDVKERIRFPVVITFRKLVGRI